MKRSKPPVSKTKKQLLISGAIVASVVIMGVGYTFFASSRWDAEAKSSQSQLQAIETAQSQIGSQKTISERLRHIEKLPEMEVSECRGSWWYDWTASVVHSAREAQRRCQVARDRAVEIQSEIRTISIYLVEEKKIIGSMTALRIDGKQDGWQKTASERSTATIKELESFELTSDRAKEVKTIAVERVKAINEAWRALMAASEKEDRASYDTAMGQLIQGYDDLSAVTKVSDEHIKALLTPII